jgi:hypothetical protein
LNACVAIQQLAIETLNVVDVRSAAELIVPTAMRGELPDLLSIGRDIEAGNRDRTAAEFPTMPLEKWKNCATARVWPN